MTGDNNATVTRMAGGNFAAEFQWLELVSGVTRTLPAPPLDEQELNRRALTWEAIEDITAAKRTWAPGPWNDEPDLVVWEHRRIHVAMWRPAEFGAWFAQIALPGVSGAGRGTWRNAGDRAEHRLGPWRWRWNRRSINPVPHWIGQRGRECLQCDFSTQPGLSPAMTRPDTPAAFMEGMRYVTLGQAAALAELMADEVAERLEMPVRGCESWMRAIVAGDALPEVYAEWLDDQGEWARAARVRWGTERATLPDWPSMAGWKCTMLRMPQRVETDRPFPIEPFQEDHPARVEVRRAVDPVPTDAVTGGVWRGPIVLGHGATYESWWRVERSFQEDGETVMQLTAIEPTPEMRRAAELDRELAELPARKPAWFPPIVYDYREAGGLVRRVAIDPPAGRQFRAEVARQLVQVMEAHPVEAIETASVPGAIPARSIDVREFLTREDAAAHVAVIACATLEPGRGRVDISPFYLILSVDGEFQLSFRRERRNLRATQLVTHGEPVQVAIGDAGGMTSALRSPQGDPVSVINWTVADGWGVRPGQTVIVSRGDTVLMRHRHEG